jgi:hypothetical protein
MSRERTIRRSQAIHPYGPGAILDWGQECFVVLDTKRGSGWRRAERTTLKRLQDRLGASDGFRLPPIKGEFGGVAPALEVMRFPRWLFCPSCRVMVKWSRDLEAGLVPGASELPKCSNSSCGNSVLVPMRYVAACEAGHLADVDWWIWAHSKRPRTEGQCDRTKPRLRFVADSSKGSSLEALFIVCDRCNEARRDLSDIQAAHALVSIGLGCPGRQPWQHHEERVACEHPMRALLRSQTAVHFSDVVSALDIQAEVAKPTSPFDEAMREVLEGNSLLNDLRTERDFAPFVSLIAGKVGDRLDRTVDPSEVAEWLGRRTGEQDEATPAGGDNSSGIDAILDEEWPALTTPTTPDFIRGNLLVRREHWRTYAGASDALKALLDDVLLIERLREVRVFRGFSRIKPDADRVPPDLGTLPHQRWLPATEVFGEGLFLKFSDTALAEWEKTNHAALARRLGRLESNLQGSAIAAQRFPRAQSMLARFMVVHTFSHLLMRQLCFEAGYGIASIRERLYVSDTRAGVLIYTADGDSEGSLGGLVRQGHAGRLAATIVSAMERAGWCSNDPICLELPENGLDGLNKSACHACSLLPETSCSHFNLLLDRLLVVGDGIDGKTRGLFRDLIE